MTTAQIHARWPATLDRFRPKMTDEIFAALTKAIGHETARWRARKVGANLSQTLTNSMLATDKLLGLALRPAIRRNEKRAPVSRADNPPDAPKIDNM